MRRIYSSAKKRHQIHMFTGIIERLGKVTEIKSDGTNKDLFIKSEITSELYIDQSIAHNGVCLTVVEIVADIYKVTAIKETLDRSNLGDLSIGDEVNLERAVSGSSLMDGHMVQGHVDNTATCIEVVDVDGSWYYTFRIDPAHSAMIVDKGSICINGVSLTVVDPTDDTFKVAIIPYTYEHTNFKHFRSGSVVNIEWDIIGKYVVRYLDRIHVR